MRKPVHGAELRARVSNLLKVRAYHRLLASQRDHALATVEQLRQQVLRADRLAMLGTFAAGVSHELNNIAHVLRSAIDLSRPGATPPPVGEELDPRELLAHVSNHVTELSSTLLRIARPNEGPSPEANLGRVLEEVEMLRLTGRTRHARLPGAAGGGPPCHPRQPRACAAGVPQPARQRRGRGGNGDGPAIEAGVRRKADGRIEAWVRGQRPGMTPGGTPASSSPSSPPSPQARARDWGCPSSSSSWSPGAGTSRWRASPDMAPGWCSISRRGQPP